MAHVTFIHGIGNKPPADQVLDGWERALTYGEGGIDLGTRGITSAMVYWADVMYAEPELATLESAEEDPTVERANVDLSWRDELDGTCRDFVESLAEDLGVDRADTVVQEPPEEDIGVTFERIPLPHFIKQRLMATLLRDVHHYLFNADHTPRPGPALRVRDEIRSRMLETLRTGSEQPGPHIIVSHSMGTVIAYDCLMRAPDCPSVDGLMTIGSPLARREIPDEFKPDWTRHDGFPSERLRGSWVNVFDHFDPVVGALPHIGSFYEKAGRRVVVDVNEQNWGRWRHSVSKYFHGPVLRRNLVEMLGG
jgi:predicted alpha/beta hydrolase family esterase